MARGRKTRGKGAIKYLVIRREDDDQPKNGLGQVVSHHSSLRQARKIAERERLECELNGRPCFTYIYDRDLKREVTK